MRIARSTCVNFDCKRRIGMMELSCADRHAVNLENQIESVNDCRCWASVRA